MQFLQARYLDSALPLGAKSVHHRSRRRERGNEGYALLDGSASHCFLVHVRGTAQRRIDHQVELGTLQQVNYIRTALIHFEDFLYLEPCGSQYLGRPTRRHQLEPKAHQVAAERNGMRLVVIIYRDEDASCQRNPLVGSQLSLGKGEPKGLSRPHDLSRGLHFRSQNRVRSWQLQERKNGRLHIVEVHRQLALQVELAQLTPYHQPSRQLSQRDACRLPDVGHGARGARVHLQNVDLPVLDGVLHIHQAHYLERARQSDRVLPQGLQSVLGNLHRR